MLRFSLLAAFAAVVLAGFSRSAPANPGDDQAKLEVKPDFVVSAETVAKEAIADLKAAEAKYINKTIEVSGEIERVESKDAFHIKGVKRKDSDIIPFTVRGAVSSEQYRTAAYLSEGQKVRIVGRVYSVVDAFVSIPECVLTELEPSMLVPICATDLVNEFKKDSKAAGAKYEFKQVIVRGVFQGLISTNPGNDVKIDGCGKSSVYFAVGSMVFDREIQQLKIGQTIEMRGECTGLFLNESVGMSGGRLVKVN